MPAVQRVRRSAAQGGVMPAVEMVMSVRLLPGQSIMVFRSRFVRQAGGARLAE